MTKGIGIYNDDFFSIKRGSELIKESIKRILMTSPGEYYGNPNFHSPLVSFLFNSRNILIEDIELAIESSIRKWEPRVLVKSVDIKKIENETIEIDINVVIKETMESVFITDLDIRI